MISKALIKAILSFYLQVRLNKWQIATDEKLELPQSETELNKIKLICKLYYNLCQNSIDRDFLLAYCDELEKIEKTELSSHHSRYAPAFSDYPFMALTIRAIRSYITSCAANKKDNLTELEQFMDKGFIDVVKYEANTLQDKEFAKKFQGIEKLKDITKIYRSDPLSFSLLDRVYLLHYQSKKPFVENYEVTKIMNNINNTSTANKTRARYTNLLFKEVANRKQVKAEEKAAAALQKTKPVKATALK